jgi:hypothetical protein
MSGSKQYDISFQVFDDVCDSIQSIVGQASTHHASFGTKRSALETLRKIGKTICMSSNDTLGHEVQKQFSHESSFVDAVKSILDVMSDEECDKMCDLNDGRSSFLVKMEELRKLSDDYCCFEGFDKVVALLAGTWRVQTTRRTERMKMMKKKRTTGSRKGKRRKTKRRKRKSMATKAITASTSNSQTGKTKRDIWLVSTKMALHEAMLEASAFWRSMTDMEVGARHVASRAARYAGCFTLLAEEA